MGEDEMANFIATCHDSFGNDLGLLLQQKLTLRRTDAVPVRFWGECICRRRHMRPQRGVRVR